MEEQKPRSATDVLLALEAEMNHLKQMIHNLDLNIRIISNKLSQNVQLQASSGYIQTNVQPLNQLPSNNLYPPTPENQGESEFTNYEQALSVETAPTGPRRTARPTSSDFVGKSNVPTPSLSQPQSFEAEIVVPNAQSIPGARKQISQRIVDKNSKPIFMAEVEITNLNTNIVEIKTRTNGTGKWQASLAHGQYKIKISKQQAANKPKVEVIQDVMINEATPADLQMMIIK